MAGRNKTTFAKLNRETKVREKRQASLLRKEQRQRDRDAGIEVEHQVEDLSHLDVAFVEGEGRRVALTPSVAETVSVLADPSPPPRTALPEQLVLAKDRYGR